MNRLKVFDGIPPPHDKVSYYGTQPLVISLIFLCLATSSYK